MSKLNMNKLTEKFDPFFSKISTEIHLLAMRDALMSLIPFLSIAGISTFFGAILFTETSFIGKRMDPETLVNIGSFFTRISTGTISLMSIMLVIMIPYFMGKQRGYYNPLILSITSLSLFFIFTPLAGGYDYFGTQGVMLAFIIGLTSSELFIKLSSKEKLKMNVGDRVPEAIANSFNTILIVIILITLYSLIATLLQVITGMEAIAFISDILQKPLIKVGATLPGAIIYFLVQTLLFAVGIHPGAIVAPIETALVTAIEEGSIINYSFTATYGMLGGTGACLGLLICLLFFTKRKELKAVGRLGALADIFNINEPLIFGIPIAFNPIMIIPFVLCPIINVTLAYIATSIGLMSVMTNVIAWSTPVFLKGYIASNGDIRCVIMELICIIIDFVISLIFLRVYEGQLAKTEELEEVKYKQNNNIKG